MHRKLLSLYGLKWNPFGPEIPREALIKTPLINHFTWKVENLVMDGGFGLITGDPGLGKSSAFRLLYDSLNEVGDINVAEFCRPQSGITDFYRELGSLFGIEFKTSNRYAGYQSLREKWNAHINSTLFRPVLLIDEAQEMHTAVLSELRLLTSTSFDSKIILTVILGGDSRLLSKLSCEDLLPLKSRIRVKMMMEDYTRDELIDFLTESITRAGNSNLLTKGLIDTVADHSSGNPRAMMIMCQDLLMEAIKKDAKQINETFFLNLFKSKPSGHKHKRAKK